MKKKTIITVVAAAITVALAAALLILTSNNNTGNTDIRQDDPFQDVPKTVIQIADDDIVSIEGKKFPRAPDYEVAVAYNKDEDTFTCTMQNNPEGYYYSETYMNLMLSTLIDLEAKSVAAAGDVNPADYGITEDSINYTLHTASSGDITLRLGATTPLSSGYYVKRDDQNFIYIIDSYEGSTLERDMYEMRTIVIYPEMESYMDLYRMKITYPDGSVIDSRQLSNDEIRTEASYSIFKFTQPIEININDDVSKDNYYTPALNLSVTNILMDDKSNLGAYGLDHPTVINYTNKDGKETELWLGNSLEDDPLYRYGTMPDVNCVFTVRGPFEFLNLDIYDMVDTTIWIHSIDDIKIINIMGGGKEYSIYIDSYTNEKDSSDNRFYAEMDTKTLDEYSVRRMYVELVSLPTVGTLAGAGLDADEIRKSEAEFKLHFTYDNDEEHFIHLYRINDMQLAADVDGIMLFYTSRSQINKILTYCEMLRNGEEVPEV